jgi:hypothetical protein
MILHTGWEQGGLTGALAHLASPSSSDLSMLAYVTVSMTVLWGVILAPMLDIGMSKGITPTLPEGLDKGAVRRVVTALHRAGTTGLSSDERMSVARDLRMASDVLTAMLQRPAWVAAEEAEEHVDLDRHLSMRAHELQDKGSVLADLVEQKHGALKAMLWPQVGETIPLIASIARDFGFDTFDFAPSDRMLPGQVRGQPTPVPQLAAPTIALADEWLSGSRGSVPELLSIAADSAARQDLDELQRSWKAARLSAPDDEAAQRVDETFGTALSDISRTLSEAISARSAGDERDLLIQGRYIESKHGGTAGDLVASLPSYRGTGT